MSATCASKESRLYAFPPECRLLNSRDFKAVFDSAAYKSPHRNILLLARKNNSPHARLGLVVAKKNARLAVQRNRLKRLIRESFRHHQQQLAGLDIIALVKPGLWQQENAEITGIIGKQWAKICQQQSKDTEKDENPVTRV